MVLMDVDEPDLAGKIPEGGKYERRASTCSQYCYSGMSGEQQKGRATDIRTIRHLTRQNEGSKQVEDIYADWAKRR
jgi:hypothetical protein